MTMKAYTDAMRYMLYDNQLLIDLEYFSNNESTFFELLMYTNAPHRIVGDCSFEPMMREPPRASCALFWDRPDQFCFGTSILIAFYMAKSFTKFQSSKICT